MTTVQLELSLCNQGEPTTERECDCRSGWIARFKKTEMLTGRADNQLCKSLKRETGENPGAFDSIQECCSGSGGLFAPWHIIHGEENEKCYPGFPCSVQRRYLIYGKCHQFAESGQSLIIERD